jgi:hypothetical protein
MYQDKAKEAQESHDKFMALLAKTDESRNQLLEACRQDAVMAAIALESVPDNERTPAHRLALDLLKDENAMLGSMLGQLPADRRQASAKMVMDLLKGSEEQRKAAQAELEKLKDEHATLMVNYAVASTRLDDQKTVIADKDKEAGMLLTQATAQKAEYEGRVGALLHAIEQKAADYAWIVHTIEAAGYILVGIVIFVLCGRRWVQHLPWLPVRVFFYHVNRPFLAAIKWLSEQIGNVTITDNVKAKIEADKAANQ